MTDIKTLKTTILGSSPRDSLILFKNEMFGLCNGCNEIVSFGLYQDSDETFLEKICPKCGCKNQASRRQFEPGIYVTGIIENTTYDIYDGYIHQFEITEPFSHLEPTCFKVSGYELYKEKQPEITQQELTQDRWSDLPPHFNLPFLCPVCKTSDIGILFSDNRNKWVCKNLHFFIYLGFVDNIARPMN